MLWGLPGIKLKISSSNLKDYLHEVGLPLQTKHDFKGYRVPHDIDDPSEFLNMCVDLDILGCGQHPNQPSRHSTRFDCSPMPISLKIWSQTFKSKSRIGITVTGYNIVISKEYDLKDGTQQNQPPISIQRKTTQQIQPHWLTTHHSPHKNIQNTHFLHFCVAKVTIAHRSDTSVRCHWNRAGELVGELEYLKKTYGDFLWDMMNGYKLIRQQETNKLK